MNSEVILLVEDNADDVKQTLRAFARNNIGNPVVVARDGEEALNYFFGEGVYAGRDTNIQPGLILLDLKLPRVSGLEVLQQIRAFGPTRHLPVVVLTSSLEEQDLTRSYAYGANIYVRKPVQFREFLGAARQLGVYWTLLESGLSLLHRADALVPPEPRPSLPSLASAAVPAPPRTADPNVLRVLLGTGDAQLLRVALATLENEGHDVVQANDARGAFRLLLSDEPDVIVLDTQLSDISGIEVARAVRSSPRAEDVVTIVLARDVAGTSLALADEGVRVLGKPLDVLMLVDLLREHARDKRARAVIPEAPAAAPVRPAAPPPPPRPSADKWAMLGLAEGAAAADVVKAADSLILVLSQKAKVARSLDERSSVSATAARVRAARTELLEHLLVRGGA